MAGAIKNKWINYRSKWPQKRVCRALMRALIRPFVAHLRLFVVARPQAGSDRAVDAKTLVATLEK